MLTYHFKRNGQIIYLRVLNNISIFRVLRHVSLLHFSYLTIIWLATWCTLAPVTYMLLAYRESASDPSGLLLSLLVNNACNSLIYLSLLHIRSQVLKAVKKDNKIAEAYFYLSLNFTLRATSQWGDLTPRT